MPVQIPRIQRAAPQADPSVGRMEQSKLDVMRPYEVQSKAVNSAVDTITEEVDKTMKYTADTAAESAGLDYHSRLKSALDIAKSTQGDPIEAYKKFDEEARRIDEDIKSKYADSIPMTKEAIDAKMSSVGRTFLDRRNSSQTLQNASYTTKVTNASVELAKNNMMGDATAHLDLSDPDTLIPFQRQIDEIQNLRLKEGLKTGNVKERKDDKGNVVGYDQDPITRLNIAKDLNDGVSKAILNLTAAGDVEGAEFVREKYGYLLTKDNTEKVVETSRKEKVRQKGIELFNSLRNKSEDQIMAAIGKEKDPEIADKALAELTTYRNNMEKLKEGKEKKNYTTALDLIQKKEKAGQKPTTMNELENDPVYRRIEQNMSPKDKEALRKKIETPKDSDPLVEAKVLEMIRERQFTKLSPDQMNTALAGLSKADRDRYEGIYVRENTETGAERNKALASASTELTKELQVAGYVRRNDFGKFSNDDQNKITLANQELMTALEDLPANTTIKDRQAIVKQFVAAKIKDQAFKITPTEKDPAKTFQGTPTPKPAKTLQPDTGRVGGVGLDDERIQSMRKDMAAYKKATGNWPRPGTDDLKKFQQGRK